MELVLQMACDEGKALDHATVRFNAKCTLRVGSGILICQIASINIADAFRSRSLGDKILSKNLIWKTVSSKSHIEFDMCVNIECHTLQLYLGGINQLECELLGIVENL